MVDRADVTREELYIPLASMDESADVATLAASATTAAASEEAAVDHGEYVSMIRYVCFLTLIRCVLCMMYVAFCRVIKIPSTSRAFYKGICCKKSLKAVFQKEGPALSYVSRLGSNQVNSVIAIAHAHCFAVAVISTYV